MKRILGCSGVRRAAVARGDTQDVLVTHTSDGGVKLLRLSLSANSYPADLTLDEARHLGQALLGMAEEAEAAIGH